MREEDAIVPMENMEDPPLHGEEDQMMMMLWEDVNLLPEDLDCYLLTGMEDGGPDLSFIASSTGSSSPPAPDSFSNIGQMEDFLLNEEEEGHGGYPSAFPPQFLSSADVFFSDILLDSPLPSSPLAATNDANNINDSDLSPSPCSSASPSPGSGSSHTNNPDFAIDEFQQPSPPLSHDPQQHPRSTDSSSGLEGLQQQQQQPPSLAPIPESDGPPQLLQQEVEEDRGDLDAADDDNPVAKKRKRQLRNRDAAVRSRERRKMYVRDLELKSRHYESECRRLGMLLQCYVAENHALRLSLHNHSQAFGASTTKQESAVLLLESLLLGSLLWFLGTLGLVILPRLLLSIILEAAARKKGAGGKESESLAPREAGSSHDVSTLELPMSTTLMMSKRCRGSRKKMRWCEAVGVLQCKTCWGVFVF